MYLAVALAKLDDIDNASAAYEKAIEMDDDLMFRLNYGEPTTEHVAACMTFITDVSACGMPLLMSTSLSCCSYHSEQL